MRINKQIVKNIALRYYKRSIETYYYLKSRIKKSRYKVLSEKELRATKTSDTIVIFGCGYSLNYISDEEWDILSKFNTIGTNWFVNENFIRLDYQILSEVIGRAEANDRRAVKKKFAKWRSEIIKKHKANTIIIKIDQPDLALWANRMIADHVYPVGRKLFKYQEIRTKKNAFYPPSDHPNILIQGPSSLSVSLNFAYAMNWKNIIFAGVDLYDRRYFWLSYNQRRDIDFAADLPLNHKHTTAPKIVPFIKKWLPYFEDKGVNLFTCNPKSLLTEIMPTINIKDLKYKLSSLKLSTFIRDMTYDK